MVVVLLVLLVELVDVLLVLVVVVVVPGGQRQSLLVVVVLLVLLVELVDVLLVLVVVPFSQVLLVGTQYCPAALHVNLQEPVQPSRKFASGGGVVVVVVLAVGPVLPAALGYSQSQRPNFSRRIAM